MFLAKCFNAAKKTVLAGTAAIGIQTAKANCFVPHCSPPRPFMHHHCHPCPPPVCRPCPAPMFRPCPPPVVIRPCHPHPPGYIVPVVPLHRVAPPPPPVPAVTAPILPGVNATITPGGLFITPACPPPPPPIIHTPPIFPVW